MVNCREDTPFVFRSTMPPELASAETPLCVWKRDGGFQAFRTEQGLPEVRRHLVERKVGYGLTLRSAALVGPSVKVY